MRPPVAIRRARTAALAVMLSVALVPSAPASAHDAYTVQTGDNLTRIAHAHGVSLRDLLAANTFADTNRIYPGQRVVVPSVRALGPPRRVADRTAAGALIDRTARRYGWNPAFVKAVAWQESGWQQDKVSSVGAIGIMQVLPSTGRFVGAHIVGRTLDLSDPADNVEAGVAFLDHLHRLTGGDSERILAGYYQGLASVSRNGLYPDTRRFIDNVLVLRERFR